MKVGIVQFAPVFGQKDANFLKVEELVADEKLDLLVLPELFSTGYLFKDKAELNSLAEEFKTGATFSFLQKLSFRNNFRS